jgi:hydrogenase/urease accessory protein HupE
MRAAVQQTCVALLAMALASFCVIRSTAHEIRPAYLEITESAPNRYAMTWRTPLLSSMRLPVVLSLPDQTENVSLPTVLERSDSLIEHRDVEIPGGLSGQRLKFVGLETTITDVLVRMSFLDGRQMTEIVHPSRPYLDVGSARGWQAVAWVYIQEGVRHILGGFDHLLFVFGLMLLVRNSWMLLKTITAFTLAHSLTLAAATFGWVHVPRAPLEAAIALSILLLGVEVIKSRRGETSFAIRQPWVMAFAFGLLHGLGFASGLNMIGLPPADIPLALLSFNVGVEAGQLLFVGVIALLAFAVEHLRIRGPEVMMRAPTYLVGCLGAYWTIDRIMGMSAGW